MIANLREIRSTLSVIVPPAHHECHADFSGMIGKLLGALPSKLGIKIFPASPGRSIESPLQGSSTVIIIDHPSTRPLIPGFFRLPTRPRIISAVLKLDQGEGHPRPAAVGIRPCRAFLVDEIWDFGGGTHGGCDPPMLPRRIFRDARLLPSWIATRLQGVLDDREAAPRRSCSVIIPCWNALRYTKECLDSVLAGTREPFEIIVVDNGSLDGTAAYVEALAKRKGNIRLIRNPTNLGFAKAVNQGMEKASGEYLAWLNSDVVVPLRWMDRLEAWFGRGPKIGAVGPHAGAALPVQRLAGAPKEVKSLPSFSSALARKNTGLALWVPRLTGFCLLTKKDVVSRVGGLDERFWGGYEDIDFCSRLWGAGYGVLLAQDAYVHHYGHRSFRHNHLSVRAVTAAAREVFIKKWLLDVR